MESIGADKAKVMQPMYWENQTQEQAFIDRSQQLWEFKNRHTFRGSPVQQSSQNLLSQNYKQIEEAMQPVGQTCVWTGYISPQESDKESLKQYSELKRMEGNQQIYIISEDKQFCPVLNKFLILLTYCQLRYALNPRFDFLKESDK